MVSFLSAEEDKRTGSDESNLDSLQATPIPMPGGVALPRLVLLFLDEVISEFLMTFWSCAEVGLKGVPSEP